METKSIMLVGVGGQGTLLASKVLGNLLTENGLDVKVSEVHGMSQRGGSVVTYVRYGDKVYSPIIDKGQADIIVSFEQLESTRWLDYLKPSGLVITGIQKILPMTVVMGAAIYPEEITKKISSKNIRVIAVKALAEALKCGSVKAVNIVLMGVLYNELNFPIESFTKSIEKCVPPKALDINLKAFKAGTLLTNIANDM